MAMKLQDLFQDWEDTLNFGANTVIFSERDDAEVMYVVLSGEIELTLNGEPLGLESPGGLIGEMAMTHPEGTRSATATTISKVKLARVTRDQFVKLVGENTEFALHVMKVLGNRLIVANTFITRALS
jgi:CRP-like cAMP-binding protein